MTKKSFTRDFMSLVFRPRSFLENNFSSLSKVRINNLGFFGCLFGLLVGGLINFFLASIVSSDLQNQPELYTLALDTLGLGAADFQSMLQEQRAYAIVLCFLSPVIAFMAPHIYGGALFISLWTLAKKPDAKLDFSKTLDCANLSLASMAFYAIPAIGPLVAIILVAINSSRSIFQAYKISGIMKSLSIFSALYISFFVSSSTLHILAQAVADNFKF